MKLARKVSSPSQSVSETQKYVKPQFVKTGSYIEATMTGDREVCNSDDGCQEEAGNVVNDR